MATERLSMRRTREYLEPSSGALTATATPSSATSTAGGSLAAGSPSQVHRAGEKGFIDYAGKMSRLTHPVTGERISVALFVLRSGRRATPTPR